jgi:hypothetical protein
MGVVVVATPWGFVGIFFTQYDCKSMFFSLSQLSILLHFLTLNQVIFQKTDLNLKNMTDYKHVNLRPDCTIFFRFVVPFSSGCIWARLSLTSRMRLEKPFLFTLIVRERNGNCGDAHHDSG